MFLCNLHCQLFLRIYVNMLHKKHPRCSIVPEEGWFRQPKYSTRSKKYSTLCRFLPLYSSKMKTGIRNFILRMRSRSVMAGTEGTTALKMREQRSEVQNYVPK